MPKRLLIHAVLFATASGLLGVAGCAAQSGDELSRAVYQFNDSLRWKRFNTAASYLPTAKQAEFLARYLAHEPDLHIDRLEVQSVSRTDDTPSYDVVVVAEAYLLPSTVLKRVVMVEHWQVDSDRWRLLSTTGELIPER